MTRTNGLWKRLGALLLALSLVVGMFPVQASAEEVDTLNELQLTLQRVDWKKDWNEDTWNTALLGDKPKDAPATNYVFIAEVPGIKDKSDIDFYWCFDADANTDGNGVVTYEPKVDNSKIQINNIGARSIYESNSVEPVRVKVICDGLVLKNALSTDMKYADTYTWGCITPDWAEGANKELYFGEDVGTVPAPVMDGVSGVDGAEIIVEDIWSGVFTEVDGKTVPNQVTDNTRLLTRKIFAGMNGGVLRQVQELNGSVIYPEYKADFEYSDAECGILDGVAYYSEEPTVTITVKNPSEKTVLMPAVSGAVMTADWKLDKEAGVWTWVGKVTGDGQHTISFGNVVSDPIVVDSNKPVISNSVAYLEGKSATVKFDVFAVSGIQSVSIDGQELKPENYTVSGNTYTVTGLKKNADEKVRISVVSNTKKTGESVVSVADVLEFVPSAVNFAFVEGNNVRKTGDNPYLKIVLAGATESGNPKVVNVEGATGVFDEKTGAWTVIYNFNEEDGTLTVPPLTAWDNVGREAKYNGVTYYLDQTVPTLSLSVTQNGEPVTDYAGLKTAVETTVTVVAEDNVKLADLTGESVTFRVKKLYDNWEIRDETRTVNFDKSGKAGITLTDGERLVGITRAPIKDAAGNYSNELNCDLDITVDSSAPEITVTFSDNVLALKTFEGKMFAVLEAVKDLETGAEETITMSYSIRDFAGMADDVTGGIEMTVEKNSTGGKKFSIPAKDLAGNWNETLTVSVNKEDTKTSLILKINEAKTAYEGVLYADRRVPGVDGTSNQIPQVIFNAAPPQDDINGKPLHTGNEVEFQITVSDGIDDADSGIDKIKWEVTSGKDNFLSLESDQIGADGNSTSAGTYNVTLKAKPGYETSEAVLAVYVVDKAGNYYTHTYAFNHDNCAPRVSIIKVNEGHYVDGVEYINKAMTYKVRIDDMFLDTLKTSVNGEDVKLNGGCAYSDIIVSEDLKEKNISIEVVDKAGYTPTSNVGVDEDFTLADGVFTNNNKVIFDKTPPVVNVTRTDATPNVVDDETAYYNEAITYTFTVSDDNLSYKKGDGMVQDLTIQYTMNGTDYQVSLPTNDNSAAISPLKKDGNNYTFDLKLGDGDKLSDVTINVVDNAGNPFQLSELFEKEKFPFTVVEDGTGKYAGHTVIIDMTAPVVKVERDENPVRNGIYYDKKVTYTITVEEANFDKGNFKVTPLVGENLPEDSYNGPEVKYEGQRAEFTLEDGAKLDNIKIWVQDYAKNHPKEIDVGEALQTYERVVEESKPIFQWVDGAECVVVDLTAPTAELNISANATVETEFVTHTDEKGKTYYYLKLKRTEDDNKTTPEVDDNVTLTATLTVKDRNLLEGDLKCNPEKPGKWDYSGLLNKINVKDTSAIFTTNKIEIPYNGTGFIVLDLTVTDAVGHPLESVKVTRASDGTTLGNCFELDKETGNLKSTIIVDRRRPSSNNDGVPEITVTIDKEKVTDVGAGVPLYNKAPEFNVTVMEQQKDTEEFEHAGLASVSISSSTPEDKLYRGELLSYKVNDPCKEGDIYKRVYNVACDETTTGECNNYILTVTATDRVGNRITKEYPFAVDTMAPAVTVEYGKEEAKNELYFNEDRKATITVEDINFNPETTPILTQVVPKPTGVTWNQEGYKHTAYCEYNTDGDYTFSMSSKDLAGNETIDPKDLTGNETTKNIVKYVGAAPQKFTIDKTRPIISVVYDPLHNAVIDNHRYYNDKTTATVFIDEHNFRAADVGAVFKKDNANIDYVKLGIFTSAADRHKASAQFVDGNNYDFTISYTDLAGNPADPYNSGIFSVDSQKPVIEITRGDMTNDELNVVSGDVILQFRITDEEKNLQGYTVKVTHLNNEFETVVVSGSDYYTVDIQDEGNTIYVNMTNILKEKINDGVYTVELTGIDRAGNEVELAPPLVFSLNRYGSTFTTEDANTMTFLKLGDDGITYHKSVDSSLIVQEINPNKVYHKEGNKSVEGSMLTVVANGVSRQLEEGKDYTMSVEQNKSKDNKEIHTWYIYTYTIDPSVFQDGNGFVSGKYSILFYSEDEAGNKNTNEANGYSTLQLNKDGEYTGKMEFVLDNMPPVITTTGIQSEKVYNAEYQRMEIIVSDTTPAGIQVFLNGVEVLLSENAPAENVAWLVQDEVTGNYMLNVPEQNELFGSQYVTVVAKDAAGNAAETLVEDFNVTTSLLVRVLNNGWIIGGGIAGIVALIIFILMKKKRA